MIGQCWLPLVPVMKATDKCLLSSVQFWFVSLKRTDHTLEDCLPVLNFITPKNHFVYFSLFVRTMKGYD